VSWIQFTPDPDAFLICTTKGRLIGHGLSQAFYNGVLRYSLEGFRDVSLVDDSGFILRARDGMSVFQMNTRLHENAAQ